MVAKSVLTLAPLRVSLLGGGTDIESFYSRSTGRVISATINKHVYVHAKIHDSLFQEKYRISYSQVELADTLDEIKNEIVRACIQFIDFHDSLQISTSADLPASSGLGSSSSFTVALLLALHTLKGDKVSAAQLAEEACHIEIDLLKSPIGKQDQYSAAFGGLNQFEFYQNGSVSIQPLAISANNIKNLFSKSLLIWTGKTRSASIILENQKLYQYNNVSHLVELSSLALILKTELLKSTLDFKAIGKLITDGWEIKKKLGDLIETTETMEISRKLSDIGALGFKLLGAGGGGFFYSLFEDSAANTIRKLDHWKAFNPQLETMVARVVSLH
ncbi:MAG: hypothetical protein NWS46_01020 [Cyclobacteriaceae bacterium]|nr:hypothetical protein [Cyclobacteriaceae bacterium]